MQARHEVAITAERTENGAGGVVGEARCSLYGTQSTQGSLTCNVVDRTGKGAEKAATRV